MCKRIRFDLDGQPVDCTAAPSDRLLGMLREQHGVMSVRVGCGIGRCGACLAVVDDRVVNSCLVPALRVDGATVETVDALTATRTGRVVVESLARENAFQCGYCSTGFIVTLITLLRDDPERTRREIVEALAGNLCRCTGYGPIIRAAEAAAEQLCHGG